MAKKRAPRSARPKPPEQVDLIPDWSGVPRPVKKKAQEYKDAAAEIGIARGNFNASKEALIDVMKENGLNAVTVEIDGVKKVIRVVDDVKLKTEAFKALTPAAGE